MEVLTRNTHFATNSRSSSWLSASFVGSGVTKYLQMSGSSVISLIFLVGIFDKLIMSKFNSRKFSRLFLASALS